MNKPSSFLSIHALTVGYDNMAAVNDFACHLVEGELACLLGPSGCGKTTILRSIAGFINPSAGDIYLDNTLLCDTQFSMAPEKRRVGMVFQDHALFPHLTIADNVGFGLQHLSRKDKSAKVINLLELIGMQAQAHKYPHEISGGQSQRVALARAIAPEPRLLLLDEPFSNLDSDLRESIGYEVRALLKQLGITAIMVTHDQQDAFALSDSIGVMATGALLQWDTPYNLYHAPTSRTVANFIGDGVFVQGEMTTDNTVTTLLGDIHGQTFSNNLVGHKVDLLIRPDDVEYDPLGPINGVVIKKAFKGAQTLYTVKTDEQIELLSFVPSHRNFAIGDRMNFVISADHLVCFLPN